MHAYGGNVHVATAKFNEMPDSTNTKVYFRMKFGKKRAHTLFVFFLKIQWPLTPHGKLCVFCQQSAIHKCSFTPVLPYLKNRAKAHGISFSAQGHWTRSLNRDLLIDLLCKYRMYPNLSKSMGLRNGMKTIAIL